MLRMVSKCAYNRRAHLGGLMDSCVFCRIVAGELPASVVYEDDVIMAFKDQHPEAPVHVLVIPKKHIASLAHLQDEDAGLMGHLMFKLPELAVSQGMAQGFKIRINTGLAGGQEVAHLHVHLTGRPSLK